jgi:hypothetical protein
MRREEILEQHPREWQEKAHVVMKWNVHREICFMLSMISECIAASPLSSKDDIEIPAIEKLSSIQCADSFPTRETSSRENLFSSENRALMLKRNKVEAEAKQKSFI